MTRAQRNKVMRALRTSRRVMEASVLNLRPVPIGSVRLIGEAIRLIADDIVSETACRGEKRTAIEPRGKVGLRPGKEAIQHCEAPSLPPGSSAVQPSGLRIESSRRIETWDDLREDPSTHVSRLHVSQEQQ
jgi:hypothetical protein